MGCTALSQLRLDVFWEWLRISTDSTAISCFLTARPTLNPVPTCRTMDTGLEVLFHG